MQKLVKETIWSLLSKGSVFVFYVLFHVFLARHLGAEEFGRWSFFLALITMILLLSQLGIDKSARKFIAQHNYTSNLRPVIVSALMLRIIISLLFTILFVCLFKPLLNLLGRNDLMVLFPWTVPIIFLSGIVEFSKNVFQGLHRMKFNLIISFSEFGLKLILTVMVLVFINDLRGVVLSFNAALLCSSIIGLYLIFSFPLGNGEKVGFADFAGQIIKYSMPLFVISLGVMVITEIDIVMIGILSTDSEVGIYAVSKQIISKLPHIAVAISLGTMPVFAKLNAKNKGQLRTLLFRLLKINSLIFGGIGVLIIGTGWYIIPLVFGPEYAQSVMPLQILVVYLIGYSYSFFLNAFLDYQGLARKRAINILFSVVLNILLNLFLIPRYGATGAAAATSLSFIPYVILNWIEVRKTINKIDNN